MIPWAEGMPDEPEDALSLYSHIPYCAHRCAFCDLSSGRPRSPEEPLAYLTAMRREIVRATTEDGADLTGRPVVSVYFGGGTPTSVQPEGLCGVLWLLREQFAVREGAEVSVEADPATVTEESLWALRQGGFNRISFGVEALDDRILRHLGRLHDSARAKESVRWAHEQGFEEISIDLILGLPEVSPALFLRGVEEVLTWPIRHVSLYALQVEEGTAFGRRQRAGRLALPPDDLVVEMGEAAEALLRQAGFERYEISSYAKPGSESVHNLGYWTGRAYRGFGSGAHSFVDGTRFWNVRRPTQYITDVVAGKSPCANRERLTREELASEALWLSLRRSEGVDRKRYETAFGEDPVHRLPEAFAELAGSGLIRVTEGWIRLTDRGRWLYNQVALRLLDADADPEREDEVKAVAKSRTQA